MRYQYVVILKKESERTTDLLSFLLCFISAMCFLYFAVRFQRFSGTSDSGVAYGINLSSQTFFLFLVAGIIIGGLVFNLVRRRRKQVRYRSFLLLAAVGWIGITPIPWIAAVFVISLFPRTPDKTPPRNRLRPRPHSHQFPDPATLRLDRFLQRQSSKTAS